MSLAAPFSLGRLAACEGLHGRLPGFNLLRELVFLHESTDQTWPQRMIDMLISARDTCTAARPVTTALTQGQPRQIFARYHAILDEKCAINPEAKREWVREVLRFVTDLRVPFTNNLGGRAKYTDTGFYPKDCMICCQTVCFRSGGQIMGQEISADHFGPVARARFKQRLSSETALLQETLSSGQFSASGFVAGFELEAWLLDAHFSPAANNETYLAHLDHPLVVPELSRFNIELNSTPLTLRGDALLRMERELAATWQQCRQKAQDLGNELVMIGILPTVREQDLCLSNMSPLNRYHALNTEVIKRRGGKSIIIDISGKDHLILSHADVMLEAATTSFQVHLQVPVAKAVRYYNASLMLCAPLVAATANSPYLFQHDLWEETRIPLFEQSVNLGEQAAKRVTFGSGYLQTSIMECFEENIVDYEILLPMQFDTSADHFEHLRLHNGTIWRWVRPLIGFNQTGTPHVRIEQRIMAAGPSIIDQIANAAFYYGVVHYLAEQPHPPEADLPFATIRDNFYLAARYGLNVTLQWPQAGSVAADVLILDHLLPLAEQGLAMLGIDPDSRSRYLDVVRARVQSHQTGATWQHANLAHHHGDYLQLTASYLHHQLHGQPVHTWNPCR